jgi:C-terminal processing protease CtpA/Prc
MARRYAYLPQAGVDYPAALEAMKVSLGPRIGRRDFALQVGGLLSLFGDGHSRVRYRESDVALPLSRTPKSAATRAIDWKILPQGIGYLGMRSSMPPGDQARQEIVDAMQELRRTRAMILDVRGNVGGSRDPVLTLLSFFIPSGRPVVLNVAAFRMDAKERPPESRELLRQRQLFSRGSPRWSRQEREVIEPLLENLRPPFAVTRSRYSDWHVSVLRHQEGSYFYDRPLVVLQDEGSASATDLLLSSLKGRPSVTLMGTTSSGGSGYALPYRLPGSGLVVQLASMASLRPNGSLYTGTPPDVEGTDHPLERALERLSR